MWWALLVKGYTAVRQAWTSPKMSSPSSELAETTPKKLRMIENPRKLAVVFFPAALSSLTAVICSVSFNEGLSKMCMAWELEKHEFEKKRTQLCF
ncbi:hypothetical protein ACLB2K_031851 [Fragaria x ananassa]